MKMYVVDAFTKKLFKGNPAGICIVDTWPSDKIMQKIAIENRFSETAFIVKQLPTQYLIRWFTPGGEIDLCGHATLASAFVVFNFYKPNNLSQITFTTKNGAKLVITKTNDLYHMSFPSYNLKPVPVTDEMEQAFGSRPLEAYMGRDLLCIFDSEEIVHNMNPDMEKLQKLDGLLQHATAAGNKFDCVSRSFAPKLAVDEDPVCGSGHCHIVPYWAQKLNKKNIIAFQDSERSGILFCEDLGDKIDLAGNAVLYSEGNLNL